MGEDVRPQGVEMGGRRASDVKGGEGREERPVPPITAIEMGSARFLVRLLYQKILIEKWT